jgi:hypothetical protein
MQNNKILKKYMVWKLLPFVFFMIIFKVLFYKSIQKYRNLNFQQTENDYLYIFIVFVRNLTKKMPFLVYIFCF